ncbi:hypothetical protein CHLNCDRAFT_28745 [Chlorella variabilis]|uniref:Tyrosine-protein kinase ephrin type A/B receptor-like domain-containing protein n=1 Tax=Chlorella variabilis TaxID=554065 RepID=E1ZTQ9_CHLVA|nr:hypothetical protein CHLNCDRAFT_28745 [Chlorella variabilis]EFN50756.1 hypothetical protein CHLNCDRAFT_28745 [Chlorella variabilis]|eukprot:XP_005842868.1 hypothetical protein CHLNCDRAFT_28745 [Chlorella variabilis]
MTGGTEIEVCVAAPKGNYAPGTGNDGFIPCEGGTYQDEEGQGACKPCPPGHQCPSGSLLPTKCRPGFWADMKQPFCKECAKGTYQDREGQRSCKPCPAGSYCQATKMAAPSPCPAGKYGVRISSITPNDCAACPINVSSNDAGVCRSALWPGQWWPLAAPLARRSYPSCGTLLLLQSYTAATGLTKCTKCTTGLWTARKTGQKLCWDNTKNLPTSPSD